MLSISISINTSEFGGTNGGTPAAPYAYVGSDTRTVHLSPSLMVRIAMSHPRIIDPSSATMRCLSDRAKGLSDPDAEQRYLTTTASPGRTTRPVPSTIVVFDTPDDGDDDEDEVLSCAAVEEWSLVVAERREDGVTGEEIEKASVVEQ
jgi:hypothetical protein